MDVQEHHTVESLTNFLQGQGFNCFSVNAKTVKIHPTVDSQAVNSRLELLQKVATTLNSEVVKSNKSTIGAVKVGKIDVLVKSQNYHKKSKSVELSIVSDITQSVIRGANTVTFYGTNKTVTYHGVCGAMMSGKPKSRKHNNGNLVKADLHILLENDKKVAISVKDFGGGYHYECADSMYKQTMQDVVTGLVHKYNIRDFDSSKMRNINVDNVPESHLLKNVFGSDILNSGGCVVSGVFEPELENRELTFLVNHVITEQSDFTDDTRPKLVILGNKSRNRKHKYLKGLMPVVTTGKRARSTVKLSTIKEESDFYGGVNTTAGMATYQPVMGQVFKRNKLHEYKRIEMPQIADHDAFVADMTRKFDSYYTLVSKDVLEPTQTEFDQEKVDRLKELFKTDITNIYNKSLVVAYCDSVAYIIDGHHRYYAVLQSEQLNYISCFVVNCQPDVLIEYLNGQVYTINKKLKEHTSGE